MSGNEVDVAMTGPFTQGTVLHPGRHTTKGSNKYENNDM
jgi:hypothetical protein